jgi:hypothetical protein
MVARSLWIAMLFFSWSPLAAQRPPSTPFVERGACPFECCQLGHWTARDTLPVYARQQAPDAPLFLIAPGQGFVADSADFHTLALGIILVRQAFSLADYLAEEGPSPRPGPAGSARRTALRNRLAPGDTIYLIGEVTETGERVWARGVEDTVEAFWSEPAFEKPDAPAVMVRPIEQEWWVHVNVGGRSGWIQAWNRRIDGTDACA